MFLGHCKTVGTFVLAAIAVAACASVFEGKNQQIYVNTNPAGAECAFYREGGIRIATIQSTPGAGLVEKTKADIWVVCVKQGYERATFVDHSGVAGAAFVNIVGGIFTLGISTAIGVAVDSANGSDNKYESPVNVTMIPTSPDRAGSPIALPQVFDQARSSEPVAPQAAAPQAVRSSNGGTGSGRAEGINHAAAPMPPPTSGPSSRPLEAGLWVCGMTRTGNQANPYYTIQFTIADDHTLTVESYANAPATIVRTDPLTFTALNPRGSRLTTFLLKPDNSMIITGPSANNPNSRFRDDGSCAKT